MIELDIAASYHGGMEACMQWGLDLGTACPFADHTHTRSHCLSVDAIYYDYEVLMILWMCVWGMGACC